MEDRPLELRALSLNSSIHDSLLFSLLAKRLLYSQYLGFIYDILHLSTINSAQKWLNFEPFRFYLFLKRDLFSRSKELYSCPAVAELLSYLLKCSRLRESKSLFFGTLEPELFP